MSTQYAPREGRFHEAPRLVSGHDLAPLPAAYGLSWSAVAASLQAAMQQPAPAAGGYPPAGYAQAQQAYPQAGGYPQQAPQGGYPPAGYAQQQAQGYGYAQPQQGHAQPQMQAGAAGVPVIQPMAPAAQPSAPAAEAVQAAASPAIAADGSVVAPPQPAGEVPAQAAAQQAAAPAAEPSAPANGGAPGVAGPSPWATSFAGVGPALPSAASFAPSAHRPTAPEPEPEPAKAATPAPTGMGTGTIVGLVVLVVVLFGALGAVIFLTQRKRSGDQVSIDSPESKVQLDDPAANTATAKASASAPPPKVWVKPKQTTTAAPGADPYDDIDTLSKRPPPKPTAAPTGKYNPNEL